MAFTLATFIGLLPAMWSRLATRPARAEAEGQVGRVGSPPYKLPWAVWALGIYGLFGYHFAYFMALRLAPPVEANLINYLWPLLIVLLSGLLPGERLGARQVGGALAGFAGAALLVARGGGLRFDGQYALGYAFALACAVIWSSYSVLSRRVGAVPTRAVGGFCAATAALALVCHLLFETTVWPVGWQWAAVVALGLGPVGAAFYVWDYGVKRGNIQTLGVLAYGAPLLSTLLLVVVGLAEPSWTLAVACALIIGGAALARG
jgi:drug/metabolite transporter (DMT)-like permease